MMKRKAVGIVSFVGFLVCGIPSSATAPELIEKEFFGVEALPRKRLDVLRNSLDIFSELGVGLLGRNSLTWNEVEPLPPRDGQHRYRWGQLDKEFQLYHKRGFKLQVVLVARSAWGTRVPSKRMPGRAEGSPPKEKHWKDWGDFVYELVERYDGDGFRDAFQMKDGLISILSVQGEIEFYAHWKKWGGTPENYHKLLEVTSRYAKRAFPGILVARAGMSVGALADTGPGVDEIMKLTEGDVESQRIMRFLEYSLEHSESYDLFAVHANRDYTGIEPFVRFIRSRMEKHGKVKPILIEDASTVYAGRREEPLAKPANLEWMRLFGVLEKPRRGRGYWEAKRRVLEHQAVLTVKRAAAALHSDVEGILFTGYLDHPRAAAIQLRHGGFIDSRRYRERKDFRSALKPVYHSLKMFLDRAVGSHREVRRLDLGKDVYAFAFRKSDKTFYLLWYEGGEKVVTIPWSSPGAVRKQIITEEGKRRGKEEKLAAKNGTIAVRVDAIPAFLE